MSKVLFIQPPFFRFLGIRARYFPYQFAAMGTYLKRHGHEVRIVEGDKYDEYGNLDFADQESSYDKYMESLETFSDPFWTTLEKAINDLQPDIIGITVWTTFMGSAIRVAQFCRRVCPDAQIVAGGPHVTLLPDDLKQVPQFDIGVIGEGEETILEIANGVPLASINGIFYREGDVIQQNPPRAFMTDLDEFGIPDRTLLLNPGAYDSEDLGLIMSSRGCPYKCTFCATTIWKRKVRSRSLDSIISEIKAVKEEYGTAYFTLKDDTFTFRRDRVYEFCRKLKEEKLNIFWECNATLMSLKSREMLLEMRSAGCVAMKVGVETGVDRIHKIIGKNLTNKKVIQKMNLFKGTGIHVTCYFMMGVPGETRADILETLKVAQNLEGAGYISMSTYEIFPATALHTLGIQEGSAVETVEIGDYLKVQPHNLFFTGNKRHLKGMPTAEFDQLEARVKGEIHAFNRRPRQIVARVRSRAPLYRKSPRYLLADVKRFVHWV